MILIKMVNVIVDLLVQHPLLIPKEMIVYLVVGNAKLLAHFHLLLGMLSVQKHVDLII